MLPFWARPTPHCCHETGYIIFPSVDALDPEKMFESIAGEMNGTVMPGWEPERMARVKELFKMYEDIDDEKLFDAMEMISDAITYSSEKVEPTKAVIDVLD